MELKKIQLIIHVYLLHLTTLLSAADYVFVSFHDLLQCCNHLGTVLHGHKRTCQLFLGICKGIQHFYPAACQRPHLFPLDHMKFAD